MAHTGDLSGKGARTHPSTLSSRRHPDDHDSLRVAGGPPAVLPAREAAGPRCVGRSWPDAQPSLTPSITTTVVEPSRTPPPLKALIVDDCRLHRENLATVFTVFANTKPAVAWDLPSLAAALAKDEPEVVLVNMGTRDNVALLRLVRETCPEAKVIVVGICEEDESLVIACAEAGVAAYHLRSEPLDALLDLMSRVAGGQSICSPAVSAILLKRISSLASQRRIEPVEPVLTAREMQILEMLELGLSNRDIADRLCIALHTVKNHVHSVLTKLGVSTRAEAGAYYRFVRYPGSVS